VTPDDRPARAWARWAPLAAVAAVVAVLTAVLVPLALRRAPDDGAVAGSPSATGRAVPVEGVGHLTRGRDGRVSLCSMTITPGVEGAPPVCAGDAVAVIGADDATVLANPGRIRVEGTYRAGTLTLTRVIGPAPEEAGPPGRPPLPCAAPPGGWRPGNGFPNPGDELAASDRVASLVAADPRRYGGMWHWEADPTAGPAPGELEGAVVVKVVGTTGDLARARAELLAAYAGNLCVHAVRYSAADLDRIVERLTAAGITAGMDERLNKVRVSVVALDPPTATLLDEVGRDALFVEEPMLQWLE
jgi:hypothetical protein